MQRYAVTALQLARKREMYVVLDADALYMVQKTPDVVRGYKRAVLTPNKVEYQRLCEALVSRARSHSAMFVQDLTKSRTWTSLRDVQILAPSWVESRCCRKAPRTL